MEQITPYDAKVYESEVHALTDGWWTGETADGNTDGGSYTPCDPLPEMEEMSLTGGFWTSPTPHGGADGI